LIGLTESLLQRVIIMQHLSGAVFVGAKFIATWPH